MKKYVLLVVSASLTTPLIAQKINRENRQYARTQGIKSEGKHQVEATAFMLRVLRGEGILGTAISDLEEKVEAENDEVASENTKAYADIILKGEVMIECKSWVPGGISFSKFISGESGSYHQCKTYPGSNGVTTLANLQYWFDAEKIKLSGYLYATGFAKLKFQELFTAKAQDLINFLGSIKFYNLFGAKTVEIFLSTHRHRRENFHIAHIL